MAGRDMHDDVQLNPAVRERVENVLITWGAPGTYSRISSLVTGLCAFVYSTERENDATNDAAWETVQQLIVGVGVGEFEEALEDARCDTDTDEEVEGTP